MLRRWEDSGLGFRVPGFGFRFSIFGFRVPSFRFRVSGLGFRVSGFGFRASGFGLRVSGLGFRVLPATATKPTDAGKITCTATTYRATVSSCSSYLHPCKSDHLGGCYLHLCKFWFTLPPCLVTRALTRPHRKYQKFGSRVLHSRQPPSGTRTPALWPSGDLTTC